MNGIRKLIEKELYFLIERGYSFQATGEKRLYCEIIYRRGSCQIALMFDWRNEYLDITIKEKTKVLIQTNYNCVVIDRLNWEKMQFSELLNDIYTQKHNLHSLSRKQIKKLVSLYANFVQKEDALSGKTDGLREP